MCYASRGGTLACLICVERQGGERQGIGAGRSRKKEKQGNGGGGGGEGEGVGLTWVVDTRKEKGWS